MKLISILIAVLSITGSEKIKSNDTELTVIVKKVRTDQGNVEVTLFNSQEGFLKKSYKHQSVTAESGEMIFVFKDVPAGKYTAYALHDKNANGKLDMNGLGIPNEPYGMSMKGKSRFGPPNYEKSLFEVGGGNDTITIKIN